jgi:hypothetical protein
MCEIGPDARRRVPKHAAVPDDRHLAPIFREQLPLGYCIPIGPRHQRKAVGMRGLIGVVAVGCLASGLIATECACGSQHTAVPSSTTKPAKPAVPREQLLVTAADFPPGAVVQQISPAELAQARERLTRTMASAKIDPPQCGARQKDMARDLAAAQAKTATVVAQDTNRGITYAVGVLDDPEDLGKIKDSVLGSCADVSTSITTPDQSLSETAHTVAAPVPAHLPADQALAYLTTTAVTVPANSGKTHTTQSMNGYAIVRGMSVEVRVNSLTGPVVPAEFDTLLTTAVTKIRDAP